VVVAGIEPVHFSTREKDERSGSFFHSV